MQSSYPSWSPYHYVARNPLSILDPTGMNWYESKSGEHNQYTWYDGDGEKEGYKNLGSSATINGRRGEDWQYSILLNSDGTANYGFPLAHNSDKIGPGTSGETPAGSYIIAREKTPDEQKKEQFNACLNEKFSNQMASGALGEPPVSLFDVYMIGKSLYTLGGAIYSMSAAEGGGRVFWSGGNVAKNAAVDFAAANGMKTLEMSTKGRIMNSVSPYLPKSISSPIWNNLSSNFAKGASGNINVFQNAAGVGLNSTWRMVEYPILKNQNIIYHIVK